MAPKLEFVGQLACFSVVLIVLVDREAKTALEFLLGDADDESCISQRNSPVAQPEYLTDMRLWKPLCSLFP